MSTDEIIWIELINQIDSLVLYRSVRKDKVIKKLCVLGRALIGNEKSTGIHAHSLDQTGCLKKTIKSKCYAFMRELVDAAEALGLTGQIFKEYIAYLFLHDENVFSLACERRTDIVHTSVYRLALLEMECLWLLVDFDVEGICSHIAYNGYAEILSKYVPVPTQSPSYVKRLLTAFSTEKQLEVLMKHYTEKGCGDFADYRMFRYDGRFVAVPYPDPIVFGDLVGCESQKEMLARNTEAFVEGKPANNILLIGSRGTGKSSCVKALANEYFDKGLRLVEITKDQTAELPAVLKVLSGRGRRFILFMDDLSFEDFEIGYKHMKSLLEGGVESRPENVLFYATSNRRHIIREKWDDRDERPESEEVHATDTLNEKLSLSDRFGITITFPKPGPDEYLRIVAGLAKREGISIPEDLLKRKALQWEISQKGMSGRTARQFINHIKGS